MNIQQLLAQCSVEDIVRTTMSLHDIDADHYQAVYDNYVKLTETLLKLETTPSDMILLGVVYEDDGELSLHTTLYKITELQRGIPFHAVLEDNTDPTTLSEEERDDATRTKNWPEGYSYVFVPWAQVMSYEVNVANVEDVGRVPLLADVLYELTFFGFDEAEMEKERRSLDESIAEMEAVKALPEEEQAKYYADNETDIEQLRAKWDLPQCSPEERAKQRQEMELELFRNHQRAYHALRKYGGICSI